MSKWQISGIRHLQQSRWLASIERRKRARIGIKTITAEGGAWRRHHHLAAHGKRHPECHYISLPSRLLWRRTSARAGGAWRGSSINIIPAERPMLKSFPGANRNNALARHEIFMALFLAAKCRRANVLSSPARGAGEALSTRCAWHHHAAASSREIMSLAKFAVSSAAALFRGVGVKAIVMAIGGDIWARRGRNFDGIANV